MPSGSAGLIGSSFRRRPESSVLNQMGTRKTYIGDQAFRGRTDLDHFEDILEMVRHGMTAVAMQHSLLSFLLRAAWLETIDLYCRKLDLSCLAKKSNQNKSPPVRRSLRRFPALLDWPGFLINSHDPLRGHVLRHIRRTTHDQSALLGGAQGIKFASQKSHGGQQTVLHHQDNLIPCIMADIRLLDIVGILIRIPNYEP